MAVSRYHTDPPELVSVLSGKHCSTKHDTTTMAAATGATAVFQPVTDSHQYQPARVPSTVGAPTGACQCGLW